MKRYLLIWITFCFSLSFANLSAQNELELGFKGRLILDHFWGSTLPQSVIHKTGTTVVYLCNGISTGVEFRANLGKYVGVTGGLDFQTRLLSHTINQTYWKANQLISLEIPVKLNLMRYVGWWKDKEILSIGGSIIYSAGTNNKNEQSIPLKSNYKSSNWFQAHQNKSIIPSVIVEFGKERKMGYGSYYMGLIASYQLVKGYTYQSRDFYNNEELTFNTSYLGIDFKYFIPFKPVFKGKGKKIIMYKKKRKR